MPEYAKFLQIFTMRLFKNFRLIYQIVTFKIVLKITRYINYYEKTIHVFYVVVFDFDFFLLFLLTGYK